MKAMRGRIALPKHFVRIRPNAGTISRSLWSAYASSRRFSTLVPHPYQKQPLSRSCETSCADVSAGQSRSKIFHWHFAERAVNERSNHKSNHLVEKTVAHELDCDERTLFAYADRMDCADCAVLAFSAISSEAGEIMCAKKVFGCSF